MQTKLTLRLDDKLIKSAKQHSARTGKSLSKLVADFFASIEDETRHKDEQTSPTVQSLRGVFKGSNLTEEDYRAHLTDKYL